MNVYTIRTDHEVAEAARYIAEKHFLFYSPESKNETLFFVEDLAWRYDESHGVEDSDGKRHWCYANMNYRDAICFAAGDLRIKLGDL